MPKPIPGRNHPEPITFADRATCAYSDSWTGNTVLESVSAMRTWMLPSHPKHQPF